MAGVAFESSGQMASKKNEDISVVMSARLQISAAALVVKRAMQTIDLTTDKTAATATFPTPSPTQEPVTPAPSAAPPPPSSPTPQPGIDPELVAIADDLAPKLRECVINSLGWKIMLGARLREYREQMSRSDWGQVLKSQRLGVGSPRTVQMLVRVGGQKVFRDSSKLALLPDCVTVLNELAGLPAHVLTKALSDGTIGPETSLKEAKHFVLECRERSTASDSNPQHA
jgi:hypothetical protein